jgi:hypothetical protein
MAAPALEAVLSGAAGPAGVRAALRSSPLRGSVRRAVAGLLAPGAALGPIRLERVKLKPGRKLSIWGRAAAVDGRGARDEVPIAVTWVPPSVARGGPVAAAGADAPAGGPLAAWHAADGATGMELLASPFDPAAPELVGLLAPGAVPGRARVTTVRYRPRQRHVLRYESERPTVDPCWVKLVPGRDGALPAAAAAALAEGLAGSGHTVLRPLGVLEGGAVLYPHAPGRPLPHLLGRSPEPLGVVAGALRQLHELPATALPSVPEATLDHERAAVARAGEHLAVLHPAAHDVLLAVVDGAGAEMADTSVEPAPAHGDCKLDHLWLHDGGVTFIDVDSAALADPARDLGKLLADLRWFGSVDVDAARAAVVRGYDADRPDPERWSRAVVWEALWLAKAVVRRTSLLDPGWEARTLAGLQEAEAVLANAHAPFAVPGGR